MEPLTIIWPGGEHSFLLRLGELEALQKACDAGPGLVLRRLAALDCFPCDISSTLRLGLIGGGMKREEAQGLVNRVIDQHGLGRLSPYAFSILGHSLYGPEDDKPKGDTSEGKPEAEMGSESGASPTSTEPGPEWDSPPNK